MLQEARLPKQAANQPAEISEVDARSISELIL